MWNKNVEKGFKFWVYRDNAINLATSFGVLAAGIMATAF
jgi:hypothetical protein